MQKEKSQFEFYEEINDFLESISSYSTENPLFCCFYLKGKVDGVKYKPPYRKGFYSLGLVVNAEQYNIELNNKKAATYNSFLFFQTPGQLMSYRYTVGMVTKGFVIFFKPELFSFLKKNFSQEFSYLERLQTLFLELSGDNLQEIEKYFQELFAMSENGDDTYAKITPLKLLALLYLTEKHSKSATKGYLDRLSKGTGGEIIFQKFLHLVGIHYLEKRTVNEYAELLSISPNYLSLQVKEHSSKSALYFINSRVINEAKSFMQYTDFNINEIAQQLTFSDTSNFVKFFKKHTGKTPLEFKRTLDTAKA